ncbi:MAG: molybdenum cofactor guanylyltransferase [Vicinamibacterales bacterium]
MVQHVTAVVLCGGRSTRMGQDKGSLQFGDQTMLERILRIVRGIADDVIVVARRDQQVPASVTVVHDAVEDLGPLAGIASGLAASATDLNIVVACDMPLIKPEVLQRLLSMIGDHDACVAVADGHASALCGIYRSRIANDAQALLDSGERRVMRLLDHLQTKRVDAAVFRDIDADLETFISVDTPGKYADAVVRLKPG